jgi:hypothetical protein
MPTYCAYSILKKGSFTLDFTTLHYAFSTYFSERELRQRVGEQAVKRSLKIYQMVKIFIDLQIESVIRCKK